MVIRITVYNTHYRTAEVLTSGKFYRVVGQNKKSKDDVTALCLNVDGFNRWFDIKELRPCL